MSVRKGLTGLLCVVATSAPSSSALAHEAVATGGNGQGWYIGGQFSSSRLELQLGNEPKRSERVGGFSFVGGYNGGEGFGVEFDLFATADFTDGRPELVAANYSSFTIAPKLDYRLNDDFSLFAKLGLVSAAYREEYNNAIPLVRGYERSWSGGGLSLGFGADYSPTQHLRLRLGLEFGSTMLESENLDLYTYVPDTEIREGRSGLSIMYQF